MPFWPCAVSLTSHAFAKQLGSTQSLLVVVSLVMRSTPPSGKSALQVDDDDDRRPRLARFRQRREEHFVGDEIFDESTCRSNCRR